MNTLVHIPLDATTALINTGFSMKEIEESYNPGKLFDKVIVLSEKDKVEDYGTLHFIQAEIKDFTKIIRENKPIAIRANAGFYCSDIASACRVQGIPLMISVHDSSKEKISQSIKYADKIVYISEKVKQVIKEKMDIPDRKFLYLPRFVDLELFKRKNDVKKFNELNKKYGQGKHILHVGRKVEEKNLETTICALKYLPEEYKLIMVGLGDCSIYKKLVEKEGLVERVFLEGGISHGELVNYYSWCDCMCTPSRWEGFGKVFIEAAACQCMIVTSDIAPMNEYLTHEETAILIKDYENPEEIAKGIKRACCNSPEIDNMRIRARQVAERFSKENADNVERENYNKLISDGVDKESEKDLVEEYRKLKKDIILYGAGKNGMKFCNELKKHGRHPIFFIDQSEKKRNTMINNIPVKSYDDIKNYMDEAVIIVTPNDKKEIVDRLQFDGIEYMEMEWALLLLENRDITTYK